MADLSRFVAAKLSGEWSAGNVAGVLTDVVIEVKAPPRPQAPTMSGPQCWRLWRAASAPAAALITAAAA